jgi:hypothetical protein
MISVAVAVITGSLAGLALQFELWTPELTTSPGFYNTMLGGHGLWLSAAVGAPAVGGICGYVLVPRLVHLRRERAAMLAWMGLATWIGGLIIGLYIVISPDEWAGSPDWRLMVVRGLFATSGGITAIHLGVLVGLNRPKALTIDSVCAVSFVAAIAAASVCAVPAPAVAFDFSIVAAAIAITAALCRDARWRPPVAVVIAGILGIAWWTHAGGPGFVLAALVWIWLAIGKGWSRPAAIYTFAGIIPALVVASIASATTATFLDDTYFQVGHAHLVFATVAFAIFGTTAPRTKLASIGAATLCLGLIAHAIIELWLGSRGMPRRYVIYEPMYVDGFRAAGVAAVVAVGGLVLVSAAMISSRSWIVRTSSS